LIHLARLAKDERQATEKERQGQTDRQTDRQTEQNTHNSIRYGIRNYRASGAVSETTTCTINYNR